MHGRSKSREKQQSIKNAKMKADIFFCLRSCITPKDWKRISNVFGCVFLIVSICFLSCKLQLETQTQVNINRHVSSQGFNSRLFSSFCHLSYCCIFLFLLTIYLLLSVIVNKKGSSTNTA